MTGMIDDDGVRNRFVKSKWALLTQWGQPLLAILGGTARKSEQELDRLTLIGFVVRHARVTELLSIGVLTFVTPSLSSLGALAGVGLIQTIFDWDPTSNTTTWLQLLERMPGWNALGIQFTQLQAALLIAGITLVLFATGSLFELYSALTLTRVRHCISERIRTKVVNRLMGFGLEFFNTRRAGDLIWITQKATERGTAVVSALSDMIMQGIILLAALGAVVVEESWWAAAILAAVGALAIMLQRRLIVSVREAGYQESSIARQAFATIHDIIYAIRLIKTFSTEELEKERYLEWTDQRILPAAKRVAVTNWSKKVVVVGGALAALLVMVAKWQIEGSSLSALGAAGLAFIVLAQRAFLALNQISEALLNLATAEGYVTAVTELLAIPAADETPKRAEIPPLEQPRPAPKIEGIIIETLTFSYDSGPTVLEEVSLTFRQGELVALVGLSGSGKSTLMDILAGFRRPDEGRIVYSVPGKTIDDPSVFRKMVGYVSQEPIIFHDTFYNNICYGQLGKELADVEQAARQAQAHEFIAATPDGFMTEVGERGMTISGGQRQRLGLARLFLQDAPVMLLDEATSALDVYTEAQIYEYLFSRRSDKIVIAAAHRLSAITNFDKIVVLHHGKVVAQGSHEELMDRRGLYYNLYNLQRYAPEMPLSAIAPLAIDSSTARSQPKGN